MTASFSLLATFYCYLVVRGRSLYYITQHLLKVGFLCQRCASRSAFTKRQNIADEEVCQAENVTCALIGFAGLVVFPLM